MAFGKRIPTSDNSRVRTLEASLQIPDLERENYELRRKLAELEDALALATARAEKAEKAQEPCEDRSGHNANLIDEQVKLLELAARMRDRYITFVRASSILNRKPLEIEMIAKDLQGMKPYLGSCHNRWGRMPAGFLISDDGVRILIKLERLPEPESINEYRFRIP